MMMALPMLAQMNDGQTKLVILFGYMALLLLLGFGASRLFRGTKQDYLLASHTIGPVLLLLSLFGTTMTAFALVGSTGEAYQQGIGVYAMLASASGIVHSLCFFLIGVKVYQFGRRYGYSTQIQFFRHRLDSDLVGLLLFPILIGLIAPYVLIGVIGGGKVIAVTSIGAFEPGWISPDGSIPYWLGSLIICAVVLIYVFFGGMRGTAWANAFQTTVFMVLGVVTFYLLTIKMGQQETFWESLNKLNLDMATEMSTRTGMSQTIYFSYMFIPLSVAMFPHLFQHWLTARSAETFKLPIVMHPIFIMIVWVPCVLLGAWASMVLGNGVPPNVVLAKLVNTQIGPVMGGFLTAGILAAIMSSLDSQFLCIGSMFANDIVLHYGGQDRFNDKSQMWIARGFVVVVVAVVYGLGLWLMDRSIFTLAIWCFSGLAGLFPIVFAALYWRRLTAAGAASGILAMFLSWLYFFQDSNWGAERTYAIQLTTDIAIKPVIVICLCSMVTMMLTSWLTRAPQESTLEKFFGRQAD